MSTKTRLDSHFHKLDLLFFGARGWLLGTGASSAREVGFFNALFSGGAVPDDARNAPFMPRIDLRYRNEVEHDTVRPCFVCGPFSSPFSSATNADKVLLVAYPR